ncbi:restriction endonuclease subunit [Sesbania bispinosa]|nr:restriction endonuclease subunit [Sesbania bispinosa]
MHSDNGLSDCQREVPIVPGITLRPLEDTTLNNTISESMGMNVSSPISSFPVGGNDQRFPGRIFGSTILLDQLTPEMNTNTCISTDEVEEEEGEQCGVSGKDMRCLPFKRRSDHTLTIGEGTSNPGGGGIPRRRVEEGNNTNTTLGGLSVNVDLGTESASAMVSTAGEQAADREPQTTFVPTPTFVNYDPHQHVEASSCNYTCSCSCNYKRKHSSPGGYSPPQSGLRIGNGKSTPGPSTIPNRSLQVPNPNGWFRGVNADGQYMMMLLPADNNDTFLASLMTHQTSFTLTQINNNFPGGWLRLMAQNQRKRQLRDEVFNVLDFMRDNSFLQLEIDFHSNTHSAGSGERIELYGWIDRRANYEPYWTRSCPICS